MEHTFLFEEGEWVANGNYSDETEPTASRHGHARRSPTRKRGGSTPAA